MAAWEVLLLFVPGVIFGPPAASYVASAIAWEREVRKATSDPAKRQAMRTTRRKTALPFLRDALGWMVSVLPADDRDIDDPYDEHKFSYTTPDGNDVVRACKDLQAIHDTILHNSASGEEYLALWSGYARSIISSAHSIKDRAKAYKEHAEHMTFEQEVDLGDALLLSALDLLESIKNTRVEATGKKMDRSIEDYIRGNGPKPDDTNVLPKNVLANISAIYGTADATLAALPPGTDPKILHILKAAKDRYVPDTIAAYLKAPKDDPRAIAMLNEQIQQIRETVEHNAQVVSEGNLSDLQVNGRFLKAALSV